MAVKLSKNVRYLIRIRDYETAHIEVGAEISHHDLGFTDEEWAHLRDPTRTTVRDPNKVRDRYVESMHALLNEEVDRIAREEMTVISGWSEISPNLAEDYLSVEPPPATMQRKPHATKTGPKPASGRGVRRGATAPTAASG